MPFAVPAFDAPRSTSHIRVGNGVRPVPVRVCSNNRLSEKSGKMKPFRFELPLFELLLLIIYVWTSKKNVAVVVVVVVVISRTRFSIFYIYFFLWFSYRFRSTPFSYYYADFDYRLDFKLQSHYFVTSIEYLSEITLGFLFSQSECNYTIVCAFNIIVFLNQTRVLKKKRDRERAKEKVCERWR